ncbi:PLP-dependent transferase [Sphaerotilus sp.]|uniref:PLP-dependent transferase n=1 Tax=Sphaerotilus sp. TaxID=2093942 RepID=UPI002ACEAB31|nr:PLP-dependent transferase [Sphaerotilus sp.]MDZ7858677.1 PLP-dependent transferase [Sphaerotilus sp.]
MPDALTTRLIHHPYRPPEGFDGVLPGVFKAATVYFPNVAASRTDGWIDKTSYTYGLQGTPTSFVLEERLATLEGARRVLLAPSGRAAVTLVEVVALQTGDAVVLPSVGLGAAGHAFAREDLVRWGVGVRGYDPMSVASLAEAVTPATRLVWLVAPDPMTLAFPDLRGLVHAVRERAPGALVALDNTWGAGVAFCAFDLGEGLAVDLSVQDLGPQVSDGQACLGSVACRDEALYRRLLWGHTRLGLGVGMNEVESALRALPSLALRHAAQDAAARQIAQWCRAQPAIASVGHPASPDSLGHAHWATLCGSAAGLVTLQFDAGGGSDRLDTFAAALKTFRLDDGWGGPVSRALTFPGLAGRGGWVRLAVGLEAVEDLVNDLARAVAALN